MTRLVAAGAIGRCGAAIAALLACGPSAFAKDSMTLAHSLGQVLASEKPCGLSFDQAAIEAFIDKNVDPSDMQFSGTLTVMTGGAEYEIQQMSTSQKTAHCRQIQRVAKSYGFTP